MNEIAVRKQVRILEAKGIEKKLAKDIVDTAWQSGRGRKLEMYIEYALTLTFGSFADNWKIKDTSNTADKADFILVSNNNK